MPPGFKRVEASAAAIGERSYIFVDKNLLGNDVSFAQTAELFGRLEGQGLPSSMHPELGIIPLAERIFAPLPTVADPDPRVVVLITDLGTFEGHSFDGFFNVFDQYPEDYAWEQFAQHSNEKNVLYIHVGKGTKSFDVHHTASIISHELQHLLAQHARGLHGGNPPQESWLSEAQAEAAMLLAGYYTDQSALDRYAKRTYKVPLVSQTYVDYGVSILFAAFLIDRVGGYGGFDRIARMPEVGRAAVEKAFEIALGVPSSFDAIFGEFISYAFRASNTEEKLPASWSHSGGGGLKVPPLERAGTVGALPYIVDGELFPYSFALYELQEDLPPDASIRLEILSTGANTNSDVPNCNDNLDLLWKPLPGAIAIYGVGCRYGDKRDLLKYRLSIQTIRR